MSAKTNKKSRKAVKAAAALRNTGMSTNLKLTLALVAVVVIALLIGVALMNRSTPTKADPDLLVRANSHRLSSAADGKVTLVEFLDLECEACGAAYPGVERLRKEYDGKITYVVRYFPIPSHRNAQLAAQAVEAAASQGKFEAMYTTMYDKQTTWAESDKSQEQAFIGFARDLGLDVEKFRADMNDDRTAKRVAQDQADGEKAGVQGTPTFFLNGRLLDIAPSYENLKKAVVDALEK